MLSKTEPIERKHSSEQCEKQFGQRKRGRVNWVGKYIRRVRFGLKAWHRCLRRIATRIDCTLSLALVVAHRLSSSPIAMVVTFRDRWRCATIAKGNTDLIFRIRPPLLHDCYWIENTFRRNAICHGNEYVVYRIASTRILRYCSCAILRMITPFHVLILLATIHTHKDIFT